MEINLKELQNLYSKKYKNHWKKFYKILNAQKDIPCSWAGTLNTIKMAILFKMIYRYNTISIKTSRAPNSKKKKKNLKEQN